MPSQEPVQVVCGIIHYNGQVLATRRNSAGRYPLLWEFPGGKVEADESPESALHRELKEELDFDVCEVTPLEWVNYVDRDFSITLIPFVCKPAQTEGPVPHEHSEVRWIDPADALQLTWAPADIPLVENLEITIESHGNE
ncbi:MAG: (deoxy)nucleoside triphosphate pyrophosphohydrolase [Puniceicoccaceae bacterium]